MKAAEDTRRDVGPVRIAIAGLGRAGWDIHIRQLRGRTDFVITDVVDLIDDRLEEAAREFECRTHREWQKFLHASDAEVVVIATQSKDHARMSWEALEAGFHVLVEKPMATTLRDVDRVIAVARENGRILTVHQNHRLEPDFCHIQEIIRSGVLGHVFMVRRGEYSFARRNDWQVLRKYGGGQLNNWGVHLVDQVLLLLDSPVQDVFGDLQRVVNPGDADDHVKVVIRAEGGQIADVEVSSACALPLPMWTIMGSKGTLVSDGKVSRLRYYEKQLPDADPIDSTAVADRRYGFGEKLAFREESMPSAAAVKQGFYDRFYGSLREGKPLFVTPESVRQVMWVLHRARRGTAFSRQHTERSPS